MPTKNATMPNMNRNDLLSGLQLLLEEFYKDTGVIVDHIEVNWFSRSESIFPSIRDHANVTGISLKMR